VPNGRNRRNWQRRATADQTAILSIAAVSRANRQRALRARGFVLVAVSHQAIETDFKRKSSKSEEDGRTNKNSEQHREPKSDYWPVNAALRVQAIPGHGLGLNIVHTEERIDPIAIKKLMGHAQV